MEAIRCIIIEDQDPARRLLTRYINDSKSLVLDNSFGNAIDALNYLKNNRVDLIFLDIHLPKITGLDFLDILDSKTQVIVTTAFQDYAIKGYEYDVVDYLLKPISFDRFLKAVAKVKHHDSEEHISATNAPERDKHILVKVGHDFYNIETDKINFIKSDGDYTLLVSDEKNYMTSHSLRYWLDNLPSQRFARIHRSFIVNHSRIVRFSSTKIYLKDITLPLGRVFKSDFLESYSEIYGS